MLEWGVPKTGAHNPDPVQRECIVAKKVVFEAWSDYMIRFTDREFLKVVNKNGVISSMNMSESKGWSTLTGATKALQKVQELVDDPCFIVHVRHYQHGRSHIERVR